MNALLSSEEIESLLRQLRDGDLTVESVASQLMEISNPASKSNEPAQSKSVPRTNRQSLRGMIAEFGTPPAEVLDQWCDQLRGEFSTAARLNKIDPTNLDRWLIDHDAKLIEDPPRLSSDEAIDLVDDSQNESRVADEFVTEQWLEQFRQAVRSTTQNDADNVAPALAEIGDGSFSFSQTSIEAAGSSIDRSSQGNANAKRKWIGVAAAAGILLPLLAWIAWPSTEPRSLASSNVAAKLAPTRPSNTRPSIGRPGLPSSDPSDVTLQTFDSDQSASVDSVSADDQSLRSELDSLVPDVDSPAIDLSSIVTVIPIKDPQTVDESDAAVDAMIQGETPEPEIRSPDETVPSVQLKDLDPDGGPRESPLKSQNAPLNGQVELPQSRESDLATTIAKTIPSKISLSLASEARQGVSVDEVNGDGGVRYWTVKSGEDTIANLLANETTLQWQWTETAGSKSVIANSIINGRLRIDDKSIYLRPWIVAEPYAFEFARSDVKPAWDLGTPVDVDKTSLDLQLTLPQSYQISWIEPLAEVRLPRGRALGVVTSTDEEGAAIGLRMDVRGGKRLVVRIRYVGRLGENLPWTLLSHRQLDQAAENWTVYEAAVSQESIRLRNVDLVAYDIGGRQGKQIIAEKIRRNDLRDSDAQTALQRIAELKGMMIRLENEGRLDVEMRTHWPDEQQLILTTAKP